MSDQTKQQAKSQNQAALQAQPEPVAQAESQAQPGILALQDQAGNTAVAQSLFIQRKPDEEVGVCPTCGRPGKGTCPGCGQAFVPVQRKEAEGGTAVPAAKTGTLPTGNGRSLGNSLRTFFGDRFGHNFDQVRVHTNSQAARSAAQMGARAYTAGNNIVFANGQFNPTTSEGLGLLAHELAHVVQQQKLSATQMKPEGNIAVGQANSAFEREADSASRAVLTGRPARVSRRLSRPVLQRKRWGRCPPGRRLSGSHPHRYAAAELYALGFYKAQRGRNLVISNVDLLEDIPPRGRHKRMISAMQDRFRSFKKPSPIRRTERIGDLPDVPVYPGQSSQEILKGSKPKLEEAASALLRPDIIDMDRREVYDVTTKKSSPAKVEKVEMYAKRLEAIRRTEGIPGKAWTAGKTLSRPAKITYPLPPKSIICFGFTNLSTRPGVISYEVIEKKKRRKKKKKKDDKKKQRRKDRGKSRSRRSPSKGTGKPQTGGRKSPNVKKHAPLKSSPKSMRGARITKTPKLSGKVPRVGGRLNLKKIRLPKIRFGGIKGGHIVVIIGQMVLEYFIGEWLAEMEAEEMEAKIKAELTKLESQVQTQLEAAVKAKEKQITAQFEADPNANLFFNTQFRITFYVSRSGVAATETGRSLHRVELVKADVAFEGLKEAGDITKENVGCGADQFEHHPLNMSESIPIKELFEES